MQKNRILKTYATCRKCAEGNGIKEVPQIRLQGNWLQEAGFEPCTVIHVEVQQGRLTVTRKEVRNG